jgi:hypothetical protein
MIFHNYKPITGENSNARDKKLKGKERLNHAFITAENAEGRGKKLCPVPIFSVFRVFRGLILRDLF